MAAITSDFNLALETLWGPRREYLPRQAGQQLLTTVGGPGHWHMDAGVQCLIPKTSEGCALSPRGSIGQTFILGSGTCSHSSMSCMPAFVPGSAQEST